MWTNRRIVLLAIVGLALTLVAISPALPAEPTGEPNGTYEYNCGGGGNSCHATEGSTVITMWASNLSPSPGADVTVLVNVTGGEGVTDQIIGVMLVSARTTDPASIPTNSGWTIVKDPTGSTTAYNYVENHTYTGSTSFKWQLKAPASADVYRLYARAMHGGGDTYFEDNTTGLVFNVGSAIVPGVPLVDLSPITPNQVLTGAVNLEVTVVTNKTIEYVVLRLNDTVIGNMTSSPYSFTLDTAGYPDGTYTLNVTVRDSNGVQGYRQITVSFGNSEKTEELVSWVWTVVAGSIAILAWIGILIVVALMIRRRTVSRGGK